MANYKATILSQNGKSYKIELKKGSDVVIFYRSYNGTDKVNRDMQALEDEFNDANKKANRDQKKQDKQDRENVDKIEKQIEKCLGKVKYKVPKNGNSTKNKLDALELALQTAIDNFIGSL